MQQLQHLAAVSKQPSQILQQLEQQDHTFKSGIIKWNSNVYL